jgi:hypothetical protein
LRVDVGVIAWVCWFAEGDPLQDLGVSMATCKRTKGWDNFPRVVRSQDFS